MNVVAQGLKANVHRHRVRLTYDERAVALRYAASVLQVRFPRTQAYLRVCAGPNILDAHAVFAWPGVVRVTCRYSGQLLVQSLPGQPLEVDIVAGMEGDAAPLHRPPVRLAS